MLTTWPRNTRLAAGPLPREGAWPADVKKKFGGESATWAHDGQLPRSPIPRHPHPQHLPQGTVWVLLLGQLLRACLQANEPEARNA